MNRQLILDQFIQQELERYESLYEKMKFSQKRLPKGSLSERDGRLIHYVRDNGIQYAITVQEEDSIVSELKQKRYIKKSLPVLDKKIQACERFLKSDVIYDPYKIESQLNECYHGILDLGIFLKGDMTIEELNEINKYKNPTPFSDAHFTSAGKQCRSKSEAMIGSALEHRGLVYWYDTALKLYDGGIIYPDFKIYQPRRRRIVLLEHFGRMDDPEYAEKTIIRLDRYSRSGFYLGINLFYTTETWRKPLNMIDIERKLDEIETQDRKIVF